MQPHTGMAMQESDRETISFWRANMHALFTLAKNIWEYTIVKHASKQTTTEETATVHKVYNKQTNTYGFYNNTICIFSLSSMQRTEAAALSVLNFILCVGNCFSFP